jgi:hypothetical protein
MAIFANSLWTLIEKLSEEQLLPSGLIEFTQNRVVFLTAVPEAYATLL